MPLVGMQRDPDVGSLVAATFRKRQPGYVKRSRHRTFDGVATFMNSRSNHNIIDPKPFQVEAKRLLQTSSSRLGAAQRSRQTVAERPDGNSGFLLAKSGRLLGTLRPVPPNKRRPPAKSPCLAERRRTDRVPRYLRAEQRIVQVSLIPRRRGEIRNILKPMALAYSGFEMDGPVAPPGVRTDAWPPAEPSPPAGQA